MKAAVVCLTFLLLALPAMAGNTSYFVDRLACDSGPYALRLPETYDALRRLGALQRERVLREEIYGPHRVWYRELVFAGLRLNIVTYSEDPQAYDVEQAAIRSPAWRIAPFRQGHPLPPTVGEVATKSLPGRATVEFAGEEDFVRVELAGRRIRSLTYLCVVD